MPPVRLLCLSSLPAAIAGDVLQKGKMPGALNRHGQLALLACGAMRLPAGKNLPALVQTALQALDVLVVDHFVVGKNGLLAASTASASASAASRRIPAVTIWSGRTVTSGARSEARSLTWSALGRLVRLLVVHTVQNFSLCPRTITCGW